MAAGPEHYREAEAQHERAAEIYAAGSDSWQYYMASAQVHATLALAAATALSGITLTLPRGNDLAVGWNRAIGVTP